MSRSPSSPPPARRIARASVTFLLLILAACGGGDPSGPGGGGTTLSGTVRDAGTASALAGATVEIGSKSATTDANGHFELAGLTVGAATARAERPGYAGATVSLVLSAGSNSRDFTLAIQEIYESGAYSIFVPAGGGSMRGAIITLGGPITSGFVTGGLISTNPTNEAGLQALGSSLRSLARSAHVALVGTRTLGLSNSAGSDNDILSALASVAQASGHPELTAGPVVMFGLSSGAREAAGFASRLPARTIGLLERVPVGVVTLSTPATLHIPTFIMQAQLDGTADNTAVKAAFSANRSQGGLWALEVETGAEHSTVSDLGNSAAIGWLQSVLSRRLPGSAGDPLVALDETTGWLGNQSTLEIAAWADYTGNRTTASWLLTQADAVFWKSLGTGGGPGT